MVRCLPYVASDGLSVYNKNSCPPASKPFLLYVAKVPQLQTGTYTAL